MSQTEQKINFISYKNITISQKKNHLNVWLEGGSLVSVAMKDIVDTFIKDKNESMKQVEGHSIQTISENQPQETPF